MPDLDREAVLRATQELTLAIEECAAPHILPAMAMLFSGSTGHGSSIWLRYEVDWLKVFLDGGASSLPGFREWVVRKLIHRGLLFRGREMFRQHVEDRIYVDHCDSPAALAYALANGEFTDEEVSRISSDGEDPDEFRARGEGLVDSALATLLNSPPKARLCFTAVGISCKGGACDEL